MAPSSPGKAPSRSKNSSTANSALPTPTALRPPSPGSLLLYTCALTRPYSLAYLPACRRAPYISFTMGVPSTQASNAILYLTYGAFLYVAGDASVGRVQRC